MRRVEPMEIGLVFWAERDAAFHFAQLKDLGISAGQIGVPPALDCHPALEDWRRTLGPSDVSLTSAVCSYEGEDYSSLHAIHSTVGFTNPAFREQRIARTLAVAEFAHGLGIAAVSCHIGFIPRDRSELLYRELCDIAKRLCDGCSGHGQDFVLETGQESAEVLLDFLHDAGRTNLKVNFDPANMVMYPSGDPIAALRTLRSHVLSVHCKDAHYPVEGSGLLGQECVLGDGEVDFPAFLSYLRETGYEQPLSIEREEPNAEQRLADVRTGISRLKQWKAKLGI